MTLQTDDDTRTYANPAGTSFNGPPAFVAATLFLYVVESDGVTRTLIPSSDYTVSQLGRNLGTRIVLDAPIPSPAGKTLLIQRTVPYSQLTDITNQGDFNAQVLEGGLDTLGMQTQQLARQVSKALRFPDNVLVNFDPVIPTPLNPLDIVQVRPDGLGFVMSPAPEIASPADGSVVDEKVAAGAAIQSDKLARNIAPFTPVALPYLQTLSHIRQGQEVSVLEAVDPTKFAGIRAGTNTDNLFTAFNNLLTEMGSVGYGLLKVPRGEYFLNTPPSLFIPPGVTIRGEGRYATKLKFNAVTNGLRLGNGAGAENLCVDGLNVSQTGIHADAASRVLVRGVLIQNLLFHGLAITNCVGGQFDDIRALNCQSRGVIIDPNSYDNQLTSIYTEGCGNAGMLIGHNSHDNQVRNFTSLNCGNAGLWIHNEAYRNQVSGVIVRGTTGPAGTPGVFIGHNAYDNILSDFTVQGYTVGLMLRGAPVDVGFNNGDTARNIISDGRLIGTGSAVANSTAIDFNSTNGGATKAVDSQIDNVIASNYQYGLRESTASSALNNNIHGGSFQADITTPYSMSSTSGTRIDNARGINGVGNLGGATPAFPATNVPVTNNFPYPVQIFIAGMPNTGTRVIQINGVNTAASPAPGDGNIVYTLLPGQTITPFYGTGTPSWTWFGM